MARAFEVQQPERIQGKKLLLIDDVLTSGATADACAQACLQAGATSVIVRTLVCVAKRRSSS
jgi:predicted amidophosphoribosyltransferase